MTDGKALIFDIQRNSFVDGPGIRTTVFFKGCNLRCEWCHNPEGQSPFPETLFYHERCKACGLCEKQEGAVCPNEARVLCGREYSVDELLSECLKDRMFFEVSGGGVTFSGGECMLKIDFLEEILKACKTHGIHTAVDTAGHVPYEAFERILPYTDLFLYDVKCINPERHKAFTGVDNGLILENLEKLLRSGRPVWVRIPLVPTVNDREEEMMAIRSFLNRCGLPERIELLPYHAMGEHKYGALGKDCRIFDQPSAETVERLKRIF